MFWPGTALPVGAVTVLTTPTSVETFDRSDPSSVTGVVTSRDSTLTPLRSVVSVGRSAGILTGTVIVTEPPAGIDAIFQPIVVVSSAGSSSSPASTTGATSLKPVAGVAV